MKQQDITIVRLIMACTGLSSVRAADAEKISGGARIPPDQRQFESALGDQLSLAQLAAVHGGTGIKEKVHLPQYDS
jgi:hypothetical protein